MSPRRRSRASIGFPGELTEGWEQRAVAKMGELLGKYRSLRVYMDACVHCGACSDKCHYFLGTGDPKNMPVARQDLMRAVYRRYFTFAGKHFPKLVGAVDMTQGGARRLVDATTTSARNAAAARCSAPTASTPPRSRWPRARSWTRSAWARSTPTRSSARCTGSATTWASPGRRWRTRCSASRKTPRKRPASTCASRSTSKAPRCCWSRRRPTSSPSRTSKA